MERFLDFVAGLILAVFAALVFVAAVLVRFGLPTLIVLSVVYLFGGCVGWF